MTAAFSVCNRSTAPIELRQPPTRRARRRDHLQLAEPLEHRVVGDIGEVPQPSPSDDQQPDQQAHGRDRPEIAAERRAGEGLANQRVEPDAPQVLIDQFQPRIRRELHVPEIERQIPIDSGCQIGFSSSHCRWPFVRGRRVGLAPPFNHKRKAFFNWEVLRSRGFLSHQG
jgi:hypothetical protein